MQKCVNELVRHLKPTTSEEEVYCRFYKRWMNCDLGDCSEKCEQYYKSENIEYIYRIEVDCFKTDGKYSWRLLSRDKLDPIAPWQICVLGDNDNIRDAFDLAEYWCKRMEKYGK